MNSNLNSNSNKKVSESRSPGTMDEVNQYATMEDVSLDEVNQYATAEDSMSDSGSVGT